MAYNIDCCWDQRIPNEPILERQFLSVRPPIILQNRPESTSCISSKSPTEPEPWLLFNRKAEHQRAEYWKNNVTVTEKKGIDTIGHTKPRSYKKLLEEYPNKPWLQGTTINLDKESELHSLNYYNPKDCIRAEAQRELSHLSRSSDMVMVHNMRQHSVRMSDSGKLWNIPTSARMTEPIAYNLRAALKKCKL